VAHFGFEVSRLAPVPDRRRGIALMVSGAALYALMGAQAKAASPNIPTMELVAARSLVTLLVIEALRQRMAVPLRFEQWRHVASRSIGGFVAIVCYFDALRYIALGEAVLLNNLSPVLTALLAVWFLGERMTWFRAGATAVSIVGMWLLVGGRSVDSMQGRGALLGAASAVASAWALISLKQASRANRSILIVWALAATCTVGSLAMADASWSLPSPRAAGLLVGTGVTAAAAQLVTTSGYRLLDASEGSVFGFLTPLFATLLGGALFGEWPGPRGLAGGGLILAAGVALAWWGSRGRRGG